LKKLLLLIAFISGTALASNDIPYASKEFVKQTYNMCKELQDIDNVSDRLVLSCINEEMYNLDYREFDSMEEVLAYMSDDEDSK